MNPNFEEITRALMGIPNRQRLEIAKFILSLDQSDFDSYADAAWENEISDRIQAVDEGRAKGMPYEEAMQRIERNLGE